MSRLVALLLTVIIAALAVGAGTPAALPQPKEADSAQSAPADTTHPARARALELMSGLEAALDSILVGEVQMRGKDDPARELIRAKSRRHLEEIDENQPKLLQMIPKLDAAGIPTADIKDRFRRFLADESDAYERAVERMAANLDELRDQRASAEPGVSGEVENQINDIRAALDKAYSGRAAVLTMADSLGMDTEEPWRQYETILRYRAESLTGRLLIAVKARDDLERKIRDAQRARAPEPEIGTDRQRLQYAKRRVSGLARSLAETADLLKARGIDSAKYRQLVIESTGEISEKILEPKVLYGLLKKALADLWNGIKANAPAFFVKLFILLAIVLLFRVLFRLGWWVTRLLGLARMSRLMRDLVDRMLNPFATIVGLIAGLWILGVNPTHLLAGVGVAGVIIGFALQDSLSNLAAGFFILATRPFDVDDVVISGTVIGTVRAMGLANTTIVTFDNRRLMVPNRKIWGEVIENRSAELARRVEIEVRIGYNEDLDRAMDILRDLLDKNERALKKPEPAIFVSKLDESWIQIAVRPWVRNADWWPLLTELPRLVKLRFDEEGIKIPVPQRDITMQTDRQKVNDVTDTE